MRIGLDALAMQSPDHARRGIGRYARDLVTALATASEDHQFVLYLHDGLPIDLVPDLPGLGRRTLTPALDRAERTATARIDRLVRENPDGLDALLLLSPFEPWTGYTPPSPVPGGPALASVVYDFIPLLYPEVFLIPQKRGPWYDRCRRALRRFDALLAISEATRADTLARLGVPASRIATIGAACDGSYFSPDPAEDASPTLRRLGIGCPFVACVSGTDFRKNVWGLIDAFAKLPDSLRERHQLVLTFKLHGDAGPCVRAYAEDRGVGGSLVLTDEVGDDDLRTLYRRCAAFVSPSLHEGFGLPILEAMHCGAAVIAGDNSSQPEVVGDAGLLTDAADPDALASAMARVLDDPTLAGDLRRRAVARAGEFSWDRTAWLALQALAPAVEAAARRRPKRRPHRPRIAVFSPFPPTRSGISDYASRLVQELGATYVVDRYHAEGAVPDPTFEPEPDGPMEADARVFERIAPYRGYRGLVYQMGNSSYHHFLYPTLLRYPGVTTLHDFCLAGFHLSFGESLGDLRGYFARELAHAHPEHAAQLLADLDARGTDIGTVAEACAKRGAYLNRRIFERSRCVVVHSAWCVERLAGCLPDLAGRAAVIPLGAAARRVPSARKAEIRARFGLPGAALVLAAFGFVSPLKMYEEVLYGFGEVARVDPSAVLLFVGEEADGGGARRLAGERGLSGRVRFLGRRSGEEFADLAAVTDVGFNLRRPPTNGETSAALLDLLRHGVATIVADVGTFSAIPDAVVRKVRPEASAVARVALELAADPAAREALGRAAIGHVRDGHDWSRVAGMYVEVIERCAGRAATAS